MKKDKQIMQARYTRIIVAIITVLMLISAVSFVFAEETQADWHSDTSNLCDTGNILDGKCVIENDEFMTNWMYEFGWWWQRVAEADITACDVPVMYGGYCGTRGDSEQLVVVVPVAPGKTYVIVLQGSSFAGIADYTIASNNFDATTDLAALGLTLNANDSLEIHGNDKVNVIVGSSGDDTIYGYGGNDNISGGDGDDMIDGGNETCTGSMTLCGDTINGGSGNDTINGGNEDCSAFDCTGSSLGDKISGGDGNDTINGGDEFCDTTNTYCDDMAGPMTIGDTINGDNGNDTINGGNETCAATSATSDDACDGTKVGDTINGGTGNDTINSGASSCPSQGCPNVTGTNENVATVGDSVDGGTGTDACTPGTDLNDSETNCE
jgi:Ca2+-binding RTX toxin-like protein